MTSPLQQLIDCNNDPLWSRVGETLVVIVGHNIEQLRNTIRLYRANQPPIEHKVVVICNNPLRTDELDNELGPNALERRVQFRSNTGWDIAMYAEAVLRYDFSKYWFMNDDTEIIKDNTYLEEFTRKIHNAGTGAVFVQLGCPRNFRTTYFGASRLFFLLWYVSIHYGVLRKTPETVKRQNWRARTKNRVPGYVQAKEFELYNLTFAKAMGYKPCWLDDTKHFVDANARKRPAFMEDPAEKIDYSHPRDGLAGIAQYSISELWKDNSILKIDDIVNFAYNNELISY